MSRSGPGRATPAGGRHPERQARWSLPLGILGLGLVGTVDHLTGYEISLSVFYTLPIAYAAWHQGRRVGWMVCVLGAVVWAVADRTAGKEYSHALIGWWNASARFLFFALVTELLVRLHTTLQRERMNADHDSLTGLLNRAGLFEAIEAECARMARHGRPLTAAYIDLDDFKQINDQHGHRTGDDVLRTVADCLKSTMRRTDLIGRLGGDEFVVCLPETTAGDARGISGKMLAALGAAMKQGGWSVGFSIGVETFDRVPLGVEAMVTNADHLMYQAKSRGKNTIAYAENTH